ncbi:MAG: FHA domain-containing protein [Candidatus Krumholzibacteria bacterium]
MDENTTQSMNEHLAKYQELVGKRKTLQKRLDKVTAEKGSVKDAIYERVQREYKKQLDEMDAEIKPVEEEVVKIRRMMIADQISETDDEIGAIEEELQEISFRHRVGEFDEKETSRLQEPLKHKVEQLTEQKKSLAHVETQLGLGGVANGELKKRTASGNTAKETAGRAADSSVEATPASGDTPGTKTVPATPETKTTRTRAPVPSAAARKTRPKTEPATPDTVPSEPKPAAARAASQPTRPKAAAVADAGASASKMPDDPSATVDLADELIMVGAKPTEPVDKMQGLVDTSEWSKEFQEEGVASSAGRRHTDQPAAAVTNDDPLAALSDASLTKKAASPAASQTKTGTGVGTKDKPKEKLKSKPMGFPVLIITKGPGAGRKLPLVPMTMTIGREHDNNIELKDEEVSRYHARISYEGGQYLIKDLDSSSGTWINEEKISEKALEHGDKIRLGGIEMVVDFE